MMAGMYLGELVRHILRDLCERGIVFTKDALTILNQRGRTFQNFKSKDLFFVFRLFRHSNGLSNR